jgi:hypothetical protein
VLVGLLLVVICVLAVALLPRVVFADWFRNRIFWDLRKPTISRRYKVLLVSKIHFAKKVIHYPDMRCTAYLFICARWSKTTVEVCVTSYEKAINHYDTKQAALP